MNETVNPAGLPLTSVVMVSYHTGPILFQAITAVLGQAAPVELILVDNGNPAEVTAKLNSLRAMHKNVKVITGHGNIGFGRGCNLGAKSASGTFYLMLNPDCILKSDTVQQLHQAAHKITQPAMLGVRLVDDTGHELRGGRRRILTPETAFNEVFPFHRLLPFLRTERLNLHEDKIPTSLMPVEAISGAFMFLRAEDYKKIRGFDEDYFLHVEDLDFCLRYGKIGKIWFEPAIEVYHKGRTSKVSSRFIEYHKAVGFNTYFRKHFQADYPAYVIKLLYVATWARFAVRCAWFWFKEKFTAVDYQSS